MKKRVCIACEKHPAITLPEYPAVCDGCLRTSGRSPLRTGDRVVCDPEIGDPEIKTVASLIGYIVVTPDGEHLPRATLIRVTARRRTVRAS